MIHRDNKGEWQCDYTQNQYGEQFDWVEDIKDPFALTFTGEDFAKGSFPYVYDRILNERLRAEHDTAVFMDADLDELKALMNLLEENMGEFSSEVTDYLTMFDRPLAELYDMTPIGLKSDNPDFDYDYDKISDFVGAVEAEVYDRIHNRKKQEIPAGLEGSEQSSDKRIIEGYEEKISIQLAGKYVIFAEKPNDEFPYLVCTAQSNNPLGLEEYNGIKSDSFIEAMREFSDRVDGLVSQIETERRESGLPFQTLTATEHCLPESHKADYEGKLVIIKPEILSPEYRSAEHQLALATGGFGCNPDSSGRAVYVKELHSGKECRYNRNQIAGLADPQKIPNWAIDKLLEAHKKDELNVNTEPALKDDKKPQEKTSASPKKKPATLQEKLDAAKEKVKEADAQKDRRDDKPKKRDERE
jgi:hypothetical protein